MDKSSEKKNDTDIINNKPRVAQVTLGKRVNFFHITPPIKKNLMMKGFFKTNVIASWDKIVGKIYSEHSYPHHIKKNHEQKILIVKVRYTRILEFQHLKSDFLNQVNLFAGYPFIDDIQFKRVEKIPTTKYKKTSFIKDIPTTPHPRIQKKNMGFIDKDLEKSFNILAHLVMPLKTNHNSDVLSASNKRKITNNSLLTSWRDRAKVVLGVDKK